MTVSCHSNQQGYVAVRTLRMLKTSDNASKEDSSKWKIDKTKVLVDQNSPEIKKKPIIKRPFQFSLGNKPQKKGKYKTDDGWILYRANYYNFSHIL